MSKEIWIFGDSYAQEHPKCYQTWPLLLKSNYKIKNFAAGGSGPDYQISILLKEIKKYNTSNIDIIFFVSEMSRINFSFLKDPTKQHLVKHINNGKVYDKSVIEYKKYNKFIRAFFENYIFSSTWNDTELIKIILFLRELGNKFNSMLLIPVFDNLDECIFEVSSTPKVYIVNDRFKDVENSMHVNKHNHLSDEVHQHVYETIKHWIDTKEKICFKKRRISYKNT